MAAESEGGRQGWLPVTHHSNGAGHRGHSFSALASEKAGGYKGYPTLTRGLQGVMGSPSHAAASCHLRRPTLAFLVHGQSGRHESWAWSPTPLPPEPEGGCNPTAAPLAVSILLPTYNQSPASPAPAERGGIIYHPCATAKATGAHGERMNSSQRNTLFGEVVPALAAKRGAFLAN